ncbi:Rz1-like lysis system protein LysC [Shewanella algae]|uniref:Rz1-like lysis system protein LysC n=2 Tax=Shewanella algae TaxID=38313 RepID=UPI003D073788
MLKQLNRRQKNYSRIQKMKKRLLGLSLLFLISLTGCSGTPPIVRTVTVTETVYVLPPESLMSSCEIPVYQGRINPDLYNYSNKLIASLIRCNVDWQALHNWRQEKANESDKQ